MYYVSEFTKPVYKAGEVAKVLGITTQTLRVYEDDGKIAYFRSEGGHRLVKQEDLLSFLQQKGILVDNRFCMQISKDKPFRKDGKYIQVSDIRFPYMSEELKYAITHHQPVTYRIARKDKKWYLTAMFSMKTDVCTNKESGVIGIDYNDGFLECVETNRSGNMVDASHIELEYHGTGNKAESEIKEKLSKVVRNAKERKKSIVIKELDFKKKKSEQQKGDAKDYNRMLHLFDYHRYLFWMENLCIKYGVELIKVNPAYTSKIGKQKYSNSKKLTVHRAAAFVIARRGQGFINRLVV